MIKWNKPTIQQWLPVEKEVWTGAWGFSSVSYIPFKKDMANVKYQLNPRSRYIHIYAIRYFAIGLQYFIIENKDMS